jgi:glycosyltransferase involved in cell wall biosynthesis
MRIVFLNPSSQLGGAERMLFDILSSLRQREPDWDLHLVVSDYGPLVSRVRDLDIATTVVTFPPGLAGLGDAALRGSPGDRTTRLDLMRRLLAASPETVRYVSKLRAALTSIAPDVIHTNGFKMHILGAWSKPKDTPVVWHIHDYVSSRPVMSRMLRANVRSCAAIVTNSKSVAEDVRKVCGSRTPITAVYNGIDINRFSPDGPLADLDALAGLPPAPPGTVRVGLVATLGRWKGHAVFLRALSMLPWSLPVRGYVVGGGLYTTSGSQSSLEDLRDLAEKYGLTDRVGFTGFVEEPANAMRALDVVVHASTQPEPFGLVIAEAMACGRALAASQAGGSAELFTTEVEALGHPPGDPARLAVCLERLVSNAELRQRLGVKGREAALERFDRTRLALDLSPIYRQLVSAAPGRG